MEDIKRKCNLIVDLLKFTFDKNILSGTIYIYIYIYIMEDRNSTLS